MKKSRLLAYILAAVMLITNSGVVYATEGEVPVPEEQTIIDDEESSEGETGSIPENEPVLLADVSDEYLVGEPMGLKFSNITVTPDSYQATVSGSVGKDGGYPGSVALYVAYTTDEELGTDFMPGVESASEYDLKKAGYSLQNIPINTAYDFSGIWTGLSANTTYYYRVVYYFNGPYYFISMPGSFTTGDPVTETQVSVSDLKVDEVGYAAAKASWTLNNPASESVTGTVTFIPENGTEQSGTITAGNSAGQYYTKISTEGKAGVLKVAYDVNVAGETQTVSEEIQVSAGASLTDDTVEISVYPGSNSCNFEVVYDHVYEADNDFLTTTIYYRVKNTESWTSRWCSSYNGIRKCSITGLPEGTEYEYYIAAGIQNGSVLYTYGSAKQPKSFSTESVVVYTDSDFPDEVFRGLVRKQAGLAADAVITSTAVEKISSLYSSRDAASGVIKSVEGVQYLKNLTSLSISGHDISDISKISALTRLTNIYMPYNDIAAMPDLSAMSKLTYAYFHGNKIAKSSITAEKAPASLLAADTDWVEDTAKNQRGEIGFELPRMHYAIGDTHPFLINLTGIKGNRNYTLTVTVDGVPYTISQKLMLTYWLFCIDDISSVTGDSTKTVDIHLTDEFGNVWINHNTADAKFVGDIHSGKVTEISADADTCVVSAIIAEQLNHMDVWNGQVQIRDKSGKVVGTHDKNSLSTSPDTRDMRYYYEFSQFSSFPGSNAKNTTMVTAQVSITEPLSAGTYDVAVVLENGTEYIVEDLVVVSETSTLPPSDTRIIEFTSDRSSYAFNVEVPEGELKLIQARDLGEYGNYPWFSICDENGYSYYDALIEDDEDDYAYCLLAPGSYKLELYYWPDGVEKAEVELSIKNFDEIVKTLVPGTETNITADDALGIQVFKFEPTAGGSYYISADNASVRYFSYDGEEAYTRRVTNKSIYMVAGTHYFFAGGNGDDYSLELVRRLPVTIKDYDIHRGYVQSGASVGWTKDPELKVELLEGSTIRESYEGRHKYKFLAKVENKYLYGTYYEDAVKAGFREDFIPVAFLDENGNDISNQKVTAGMTIYVKYEPEIVHVQSVSLDKTSLILNSKATYTLKAALNSGNAYKVTNNSVTWTTSNANVATVSNKGVVTAVANGTATITAKTVNGKTATCTVTVKPLYVPSTGIKLNVSTCTVAAGKTYALTGTLTPSDSTDKITWTSSNTKIVTVSADGVVKGIAKGTATITAKTTSGKTSSCKVTVTLPATSVTLDKTTADLNVGKKLTLKAKMNPSKTTDTITWSSSNTKVATVTNKGAVTAVGKGTATITAQATSGIKATCTINVKVPATALKLKINTYTLNVGKTFALSGTMTPGNTTDTITWSTSKASIATVSADGIVKAVGKGTATITAKTTSGKKATCKVTVTVPATGVSLNASSVTLNAGKSYNLKGTVAPKNSNDGITWSSSNPAVATVSNKGAVKAIARGTAVITAQTTSGKTATCTVTVTVPAKKVTLNITKHTLNVGESYALRGTLTPSNSNDGLTWSSSQASIATVTADGVVTAVGKGTATITVKTTSGKKATCKVTVNVPATSVKLNVTDVTINKGKSYSLKATMSPSTTTDKLTWSSSNTSVATVNSKGAVKAVGKGIATITAKTTSGKTATCKVTVMVPAKSVKLSAKSCTLQTGAVYTLKATLNPTDSTDRITWSSSDLKIATVSDDGIIKAVVKGTATITVKATSGKQAKFKVIVK